MGVEGNEQCCGMGRGQKKHQAPSAATPEKIWQHTHPRPDCIRRLTGLERGGVAGNKNNSTRGSGCLCLGSSPTARAWLRPSSFLQPEVGHFWGFSPKPLASAPWSHSFGLPPWEKKGRRGIVGRPQFSNPETPCCGWGSRTSPGAFHTGGRAGHRIAPPPELPGKSLPRRKRTAPPSPASQQEPTESISGSPFRGRVHMFRFN